MDKELVLTKIADSGVVAVVRAENGEKAKRIADACLEGGVPAIELTFTVPFAHKVIEDLAKEYQNGEMILGAGTVMDPETARIAILSGAQYVVSPYFSAETVKLCNRYRVPCMPGAMTIKEVVEAMESGADIVKVFPGEAFGPKILKAIKDFPIDIKHGTNFACEKLTTGNKIVYFVTCSVDVGEIIGIVDYRTTIEVVDGVIVKYEDPVLYEEVLTYPTDIVVEIPDLSDFTRQ